MRSPANAGVVIPSYREADNIAALIEAIVAGLPRGHVVVVDDSPDLATVDAVERLKLPQIQVVHRDSKGGRGSAVLEGMRLLLQQGCERIVEMDADFSHPPQQVPELLARASTDGIDLLIASRYLPGSRITNWPLSRRLFSRASNLFARAVLRVPVHDYTNGFRAYSQPAAQSIVEHCGHLGRGFISLSEILVSCYYRGFKVAEVPTIFTNRIRGESSLNPAEITNALVGLYRIFWLKRELQGDKWPIGNGQSNKSG